MKKLFLLTPILGLLTTFLSFYYQRTPGDVLIRGFPFGYHNLDTIIINPEFRVRINYQFFIYDFVIWTVAWIILFAIGLAIVKRFIHK